MKLLATISDCCCDDGSCGASFKLREAARAILLDDQGRMALLNVSKVGYLKLPGGGIEPGENILQALRRELLEETGCRATINPMAIGATLELRRLLGVLQISYCYIARVVGKPGRPHFSPGEKSKGFQLVWVAIDEALDLLRSHHPRNRNGRFIVNRDMILLAKAITLINKR